MADAGANEVMATLSQAADRLDGAADSASSVSSPPHEMTPSGFQAVNAGATAEKPKPAGDADVHSVTPPKSASVSQKAPQTAQTSSGPSQALNPSLQADGLDGTMTETAAATYGTRSRNRTGNARPNYAEDQEMEIDYSSAATTTTKKKAPADTMPASQNASEAKRAQDLSRLVPGGVNGTASHADTPGPKEATPTASGNSKKRKAVAAPPSTQTPPVSNSPLPGATRKPTAASAMARETNIMTFTKHKSCLNKKGELIADDGTKLCVNGTSSAPVRDLLFEVAAYPALSGRRDTKAKTNKSLYRSRVPCLRTAWRSILPMSNNGISACALG